MEFLYLLIKKIKKNFLLTIIIFTGLVLRLVLTNPGYYYRPGDEILFSQAIYMLINGTLSLKVQLLGFPPLIPWIMLLVFPTVFVPVAWLKSLLLHFADTYMFFLPPLLIIVTTVFLVVKKFKWGRNKGMVLFLILFWISLAVSGSIAISKTNAFHTEVLGKNWINALYWGRYLTAILGAGTVFLTYKVARIFFERRNLALIAAFFTGVNYRLVLSSHVGLPDMYNAFFVMLAMLAIGVLLKNPTVKQYFITWIALTLSFLIKYQTHVFIPFFIAHTVISLRATKHNKEKSFVQNFLSSKVILGGITALAIVLVSHIYHFMNWERVLEINRYEAIKYAFGTNRFNMFALSYIYHIGIGPILSILAVGGLIWGLVRKNFRLSSFLLLSTLPLFAFLYLFYTGGGFFTRNFIAAFPIVLIFSALFINQLFETVLSRKIIKFDRTLVGIIFIVFVIFSAKDHIVNSVVAAKNYSSQPPRVAAQNWVDENIHGNVVFARYGGNPLPSDPGVIDGKLLPFSQAFSYQELIQENYDWASIELSWVRFYLLWWMRHDLWGKPDYLLSQTYIALAFRELLWSHTQEIFLSPWQAPTDQFAIVKLEKQDSYKKTTVLKNYKTFVDWEPIFLFNKDKESLQSPFDQQGVGELLYINKGNFLPGSVRWQSPSIEVKPGYGYNIIGRIKNTDFLEKEERSGFLRLDFYSNNEQATRFTSFVSERVWGGSDWHEVKIQAVAPENAKFGRVSFQSDNTNAQLILSEVEIKETIDLIPDEARHFTISDDDLFLPNNQGIL